MSKTFQKYKNFIVYKNVAFVPKMLKLSKIKETNNPKMSKIFPNCIKLKMYKNVENSTKMVKFGLRRFLHKFYYPKK